jgi:hypothetical protein
MLWIEDIVVSTSTSPLFTNSRVNMIGFVDLHKVVARRNAFSTFPSAWNRVELEGGAKSEGLKLAIFTSRRGFRFTRNP